MTSDDRKRLWNILWKNAHRDYRGTWNGEQTVMGWAKYHNGGSSLVSITTISEAELLERTANKR